MSKTKKKILATALHLFNTEGLANITLRGIALEMGISQGNLSYHYKKRGDIIEALYLELVEKMNEGMQQFQGKPLDLSLLYEQSRMMLYQFYQYRFFMLDFVQIVRNHKSIREHYQALQTLRTQQFMYLFEQLQQEGIFRSEAFDGEYQNLYKRMTIMGDFWLSSAVLSGPVAEELVDEYAQILFEGMYPYLTASGQASFLALKATS